MVGFTINEVMTGTHQFINSGDDNKFFEFCVDWGTDNFKKWIDPYNRDFLTNNMDGTVTVDGLCENTPCHGSLQLRYFKDQKIVYVFTFEVNNVLYKYIGEKVNIKPWNLLTSHTTCFGTITDDTGKLISRSITHFKVSTIPAFLSSFRLIY